MIDLKPLRWNWPAVTAGDTYPAARITETESDTALVSMRIYVKDSAGEIVLDLSSDAGGITIADTTAGAWDFTIDVIPAATTDEFTPGFLSYDMESTDDAGTVFTEFSGVWEILPQITK